MFKLIIKIIKDGKHVKNVTEHSSEESANAHLDRMCAKFAVYKVLVSDGDITAKYCPIINGKPA